MTQTVYDIAPEWLPSMIVQNNLRNRVSATRTFPTTAGFEPTQTSASYFNYDFEGNVAEVVQENDGMIPVEKGDIPNSDGLKHIKYDYDLISGKVNEVSYQDGKWDQFYYHYNYDADNRVTQALTSRDHLIWNQEASYRYYLHGPLARTELGNDQVQALDYAYTLQGWIKGMNGQRLTGSNGVQTDMSGNGITGGPFSLVARNQCAYSLGYYANDYQPIGGTSAPAFSVAYQPQRRPTPPVAPSSSMAILPRPHMR